MYLPCYLSHCNSKSWRQFAVRLACLPASLPSFIFFVCAHKFVHFSFQNPTHMLTHPEAAFHFLTLLSTVASLLSWRTQYHPFVSSRVVSIACVSYNLLIRSSVNGSFLDLVCFYSWLLRTASRAFSWKAINIQLRAHWQDSERISVRDRISVAEDWMWKGLSKCSVK